MPSSCCVRSAACGGVHRVSSCSVCSSALVMEHIALAPAAIAAPVSVAEHIAPFLQCRSACVCSVFIGRPGLHGETIVSSKCGVVGVIGRVWHHLGRRVHPEFGRNGGVHVGAIPDAPLQRRSLPKSKCMRRASLPALEKYELIERLVRALEMGQFLEEYDDPRDALVRFARRLTHHLDAIGERWLHFALIKPLCALRVAGLVARGQLQQMNDSATSQLDGMRASRDDHVEAHRQQEVRIWTSVLGVVHTEVLGQLGLAHTDPEHCCSVGELVAECWLREPVGIGGQVRPH